MIRNDPSAVSGRAEQSERTEQEIRRLAAFPRFYPNPIFELSADGSLAYSNEAAQKMAHALNKEGPGALLPLKAGNIAKTCLSTGQNRLHVRAQVAGRTLSWSFFPILTDHVVHCYAEDVTDRLNLEAQVRQMQKMESVGQFAAGIAHDFNNVLTVVQGHAGLILSEPNLDHSLAESAREISQAAERAANLTRQLLTFSRRQVMQPRLLDLNEVLANITKMLRSLLGERVGFRCTPESPLPPIYADPGMLEQVLINLAVNARDAMPKGGTLAIQTRSITVGEEYVQTHAEARPGCFVCLKVSDTGVGMSQATLSRIFEPFFTTKQTGKGTGLGLSTVYGIVKQHKGWMDVESQLGRGTTFSLFLPASSKPATEGQTTTIAKVPGGQETILIVEDEDSLRDLMNELLRKKGYTVYEASTGAQALAIWEQQREKIDLLLTDLMMPEGISGRELAEKALAEKPSIKVLYTSGYHPEVLFPGLQVKDGVNFLQKPYTPELLARVVRDCLDQ